MDENKRDTVLGSIIGTLLAGLIAVWSGWTPDLFLTAAVTFSACASVVVIGTRK